MSTDQVLSRRALNRATLARQLLLERGAMSPEAAIEHLVGLQAQTPHSWYVGLGTRLKDVRTAEIADLLITRRAVRIALMRGTIHFVTARDCLWLRPLVQVMIERGMAGNFGRHLTGLDRAEVTAAGRALVEERPLTPTQLGKLLAEHGRTAGWGERDPAALAQAIRAWVPLVQVPPRGIWGQSGPIAHTSAEAWLGQSLAEEPSREDLVLRYLASFGPAMVKDVQTFSGLTKLREVIERLRPRLVSFRDEKGNELFDLPDAPRPDPATPAPVRFLYDFDNLLLSHADRSRVLTSAYASLGPPPNIQPSALLVDGFTNGTWKLVTKGDSALLVVKPLRPLTRAETAELTAEAEHLLDFVTPDVSARDLRVIPYDDPETVWTAGS